MINFNVAIQGVQNSQSAMRVWERNTQKAVKKTLRKEAVMLRGMMQTGIRSQAPGGQKFQELAEVTKLRKGSSLALIDKSDLLRSHNVTEVEGSAGMALFVGVHRNVPGKHGKPMYNLAEIHNYGTKDGRIPAREWLGPVYAEWLKDAEKRFMENITKELNLGKLGQLVAQGSVVFGAKVS